MKVRQKSGYPSENEPVFSRLTPTKYAEISARSLQNYYQKFRTLTFFERQTTFTKNLDKYVSTENRG